MAATTLAFRRLYQQHLSQNPFENPVEAVSWLGAVQAQDYFGAQWALGLRMQNATDDMIERVFNDGSLLRTHVMRPTWHFVTPADIRWLLELTAPRVKAKLTHMDRRLEVDSALILNSNAVISKALQGGKQLTRVELGAALAQAGIAIEGLRLLHIVMHAELDGIICSGPRRSKQFTYMLLAERAPQANALTHDEALAELTQRYFTSHGPATVRDFVWWSGLTVADTKAGLAMLGSQLTHEMIDGQVYWFSPQLLLTIESREQAFLLPTYDEFLVGYAAFDQSRRAGRDSTENLAFTSTIVVGGKVIGDWRRILKKGLVVIEVAPFVPLTATEVEAINIASQRYGEFLNMRVQVERFVPKL